MDSYSDYSVDNEFEEKSEIINDNWKENSLFAEFELKMVMNSGHSGLIRTIKLDPSTNCKYYITGSDDTTVRIWSTSKLKNFNSETKNYQASLKGGHKMAITDLLINPLQTNEVFSCSEDKLALKWDLNKRQIVNQFFGHSSGIKTLSDHPSIRDLIFTGSKDKSCKIWDSRSKGRELLTLTGHKDTVNKVLTFATDPQVITCSNDRTIRFYDLRQTGKCTKIISYHSNPVRTMCKGSEIEGDAFVSASVNQVFSWDAENAIPLSEFQIKTDVEDSGIISSMNIVNHGKNLLLNTNSGFKYFDYFSGKKLNLTIKNDPSSKENILASATNSSLSFGGESDSTVLISSSQQHLKIFTL
ncbi:hypothetical protein QEN19_001509 [Hanseniaspora menglaensis]